MRIKVRVMTKKVMKFVELEDEECLLRTIKFKRPTLDPEKDKGSRFTRAPNFAVPCCYDERPVSADGRVSFHFKHTLVVKRRTEVGEHAQSDKVSLVVTGDKDVRRTKTATRHYTDAADNESYISRPGAVMTVAAAAFDEYIGSGNLECEQAAVFTNIHTELDKRMAFWDIVTRIERNPSRDVVSFHPDRLSAANWRTLVNELSDREEVREALEKAASACEQRESEGLRGEMDPVSLELEAREFTKIRKQLRDLHMLDRKKPAVNIKRGRGGRVQRRMVGEFPNGLDVDDRLRIAFGFSEYLRGKKMMYTVVIHAPDPHNHEDNHHMHAVAYDRPCKYLEEHCCWDLEYAVTDKRGRVRYPKRQKKNGSLTRASDGTKYWEHGAAVITEMRKTWEELCNAELRKKGVNRLFDHRSYIAMGIPGEPGRHLGTKAAALEAFGIPTYVGIENAEKSWQRLLDQIEQAHIARKQLREDCRREANEVLERARVHQPNLPEVKKLEDLVAKLNAVDREIGNDERDLALYACWLKMANSRADQTIQRCQPILDAIDDGTAKSADSRWEDEIRERRDAAEQHLTNIRETLAEDLENIAEATAEIARKSSSIDLFLDEIQAFTDELAGKLARTRDPGQKADVWPVASAVNTAVYRDRKSRQLQEYFEAPLDYEEEWNRVFDRIKLEQLEVVAPTDDAPVYRVPGISKEDFDRLTNPIFRKRSQARLAGMHQIQEWNRARAHEAAEPEVADTSADSDRSFDGSEVDHQSRNAKYEALEQVAQEKAAQDRRVAIDAWFSDLDRGGGSLPIRFKGNDVELDVDALPLDLRTFGELMADRIAPYMAERVDKLREELKRALTANPKTVAPCPQGFIFYRKHFPAHLRPHLGMLFHHDEVSRNYAMAAVAHQAEASPVSPQQSPAIGGSPAIAIVPSVTHQSKVTAAPVQKAPPTSAVPTAGYSDEEIAIWQRTVEREGR